MRAEVAAFRFDAKRLKRFLHRPGEVGEMLIRLHTYPEDARGAHSGKEPVAVELQGSRRRANICERLPDVIQFTVGLLADEFEREMQRSEERRVGKECR